MTDTASALSTTLHRLPHARSNIPKTKLNTSGYPVYTESQQATNHHCYRANRPWVHGAGRNRY